MSKNGNRETKFMEYLALGMNITEAGLKAGYSQSYSKTDIRRKLNSPRFISKLAEFADQQPETRTTLAKLRLPKLYNLEDKFFDKCEDDPELYARYSKISEREYKLAGLMTQDVQAQIIVPVSVAIQVQNHLQQQESVSSKDDIVTITDGSDKDSK